MKKFQMCKFKSLGLLTSFQVGWFFLDYLWRCSEIWFKSTKHQKASLLKRSPWNVLTIWCGNVKEWNWKSTSNGVNILSCRHKYKEANEYGKRNKYSKMVQTISQGRKSIKMYTDENSLFSCLNSFLAMYKYNLIKMKSLTEFGIFREKTSYLAAKGRKTAKSRRGAPSLTSEKILTDCMKSGN